MPKLRPALTSALLLTLAAIFPLDAEARERGAGPRALSADDLARTSLEQEYAQRIRLKRLEEIRFAEELLRGSTLPQGSRAELMLWLADLYFEEGRTLYLEAVEAWDDALLACELDDPCDLDALLSRGPDTSESHRWQEQSVLYYERILRDHPGYERADEASYYMASALKDLGEDQRSLRELTRLIKSYPDSELIPDAYVMIGEHHFEVSGDAYRALMAYKRAAASPDAPRYSFAPYKLAWCYFNVGEYEQAVEEMERVYGEILQTGAGEWGVAALVQLGQAYEDMSGATSAAPTPSHLEGAQIALYRQALQDQAALLEQRAVATYEIALEKAWELRLYTPPVRRADG